MNNLEHASYCPNLFAWAVFNWIACGITIFFLNWILDIYKRPLSFARVAEKVIKRVIVKKHNLPTPSVPYDRAFALQKSAVLASSRKTLGKKPAEIENTSQKPAVNPVGKLPKVLQVPFYASEFMFGIATDLSARIMYNALYPLIYIRNKLYPKKTESA
jgi:hypothetical protein